MKVKNFIIFILIIILFYFSWNKYFSGKVKKAQNSAIEYVENQKAAVQKAKIQTNEFNYIVLKEAISKFKLSEDRYPTVLDELVTLKYVEKIPEGNWKYNNLTGEIIVE